MQSHSSAYIQTKLFFQKRHVDTPVFIAARCTVGRTWKQLKYPSMEEWIGTVWYINIDHGMLASPQKTVK